MKIIFIIFNLVMIFYGHIAKAFSLQVNLLIILSRILNTNLMFNQLLNKVLKV